ncbi:hypothetical protein CABS03_04782 [Colletotrichum abscissum]|uniref:Uncharacterized protein n=2 Tax=Colletotrichum acutatum species complex TaxID=2707335 RepID=A0A9P9XDG2_9PEZI|nr:hypothetical protein CABS02_07976 [Colletotrichum abscissum]KAK0367915.1 hypothetical protein CLIM01_14728 [Colletotrichum limetticola]
MFPLCPSSFRKRPLEPTSKSHGRRSQSRSGRP